MRQCGPTQRVQRFLLSLLQPATLEKYDQALGMLEGMCQEYQVTFDELDEEAQDYFLCECLLDLHDREHPLQSGRLLIAAAQKIYGGRRK